jgi:hypothetical protein
MRDVKELLTVAKRAYEPVAATMSADTLQKHMIDAEKMKAMIKKKLGFDAEIVQVDHWRDQHDLKYAGKIVVAKEPIYAGPAFIVNSVVRILLVKDNWPTGRLTEGLNAKYEGVRGDYLIGANTLGYISGMPSTYSQTNILVNSLADLGGFVEESKTLEEWVGKHGGMKLFVDRDKKR